MSIQQIPEVGFLIKDFFSDACERNYSFASPGLQSAVADMQPHHNFLFVDPDFFRVVIFHKRIFLNPGRISTGVVFVPHG
jgi:hypothetical protein